MTGRTRFVAAAGLAGVFLLLLPSVAAADLIVAGVVALIAFRLGRTDESVPAPPPRRIGLRGAAFAVALLARALFDAGVGAWRVLGAVLGGRALAAATLVELPFGERTDHGAAINGMLITLSPGTVLVALDADARVLVFHVVATDAEAFRRSAERLYALQRRILP